MVQKRSLPKAHNPLLQPEHTPQLEILIQRRRLGQTDLTVKPTQVGVMNATKAENLGIFDYAHLRVPLPQDLSGSEIFSVQKTGSYPESYFLMRRSIDGFISATGMFKAAFPWATEDDEKNERKYHKTLPSAGHEEVAGNVWVDPTNALKLADEYRMRQWIVALLDPADIEKGTKDHKQDIATPPKFILSEKEKLLPPQSSTRRKRELRSASPSKIATPSRKMASPRKPRTTRGKAPSVSGSSKSTKESPVENGSKSTADGSINGDKVRVQVDEVVEKHDDVETVHTNVKVEMPADHPDLPLPESTEELIAKAKEMVEEANKLEGKKSNAKAKRKAEELTSEDAEDNALEVQPAKRTKTLQTALRTEKVKTRALIGITTTLAIGAAIQYFF